MLSTTGMTTTPKTQGHIQQVAKTSRISGVASLVIHSSLGIAIARITSVITDAARTSSQHIMGVVSDYLGHKELANRIDLSTYPMAENPHWTSVPEQFANLLNHAISLLDVEAVSVLCRWGPMNPTLKQHCMSRAARLGSVDILLALLNGAEQLTEQQLTAGIQAAISTSSMQVLNLLLARGDILSQETFLAILCFVVDTVPRDIEMVLSALLATRSLSASQLTTMVNYIIGRNHPRALDIILTQIGTFQSINTSRLHLDDQNQLNTIFLSAACQNSVRALAFLSKITTAVDLQHVFIEAASCSSVDSLRWLRNNGVRLTNQQVYDVLAKAAQQGDLPVLDFMLREAQYTIARPQEDDVDAPRFLNLVTWAIEADRHDTVVYLMDYVGFITSDEQKLLLLLTNDYKNTLTVIYLSLFFQQRDTRSTLVPLISPRADNSTNMFVNQINNV